MAGNPNLTFSTQIAVNNPCYKTNKFIKPIELCLHSVGCPQPNAQNFATSWNNPNRKAQNLCHGVIDDKIAIITLNCMDTPGKVRRAWHGGECTYNGKTKSSNNTAIAFETTESSYIKYVGGATFTYDRKNLDKIIEFYNKVFDNAVEVYARLAVFHNINDFSKDTIYCHHEGYVYKHNSSNHGDVEHTFNQIPELGWSMDRFRNEVKERVEELKIEEEFLNMKQADFDKYLLNASPEVIDKLMSAYDSRVSKLPASKWAKADLEWVKEVGIMSGGDGGNLMPKSDVTREQFAAMLHRYHENFVRK